MIITKVFIFTVALHFFLSSHPLTDDGALWWHCLTGSILFVDTLPHRGLSFLGYMDISCADS